MKKDKSEDQNKRGGEQKEGQGIISYCNGKYGKEKIDRNSGNIYKIKNEQFINYIKIRLKFKFFGQPFKN
jgi:hypothetical protein